MRILHCADLHLGKVFYGHSLWDDQRFVLEQIRDQAEREKVDLLVIAGDVYDRPIPSLEAQGLFDDFLTSVRAVGVEVLVCSGNHDSAERLGFASRLLQAGGITLATRLPDRLGFQRFSRGDEAVALYTLPYLSRAKLRQWAGERWTGDFVEAFALYLSTAEPTDLPRFFIGHQFVLPGTDYGSLQTTYQPEAGSPEPENSLDQQVGALDCLPFELFKDFTAVLLGHIHRPWDFTPLAGYSGSPLLYSRRELSHGPRSTKLFETVDGRWQARRLPLQALRAVKVLSGSFQELCAQGQLAENREAYVFLDCNDEQLALDALPRLRDLYPYLCQLRFPNVLGAGGVLPGVPERPDWQSVDLVTRFGEFYERIHGRSLSPEALELLRSFVAEQSEEVVE